MPNNITILTTSSGSIAYCSRQNEFVIDNVLDGFDLYRLDTVRAQWLRSFRTSQLTVRMHKQVTFCEDDEVVVGGSDHGKVYAFDRRSGQSLDELPHEDGGMVQTISVSRVPRFLAESDESQARDTAEGTLVGAATSADRGRISISIWKRSTGASYIGLREP
jgi:outer membrane protein assembly factor BamB